MTRREIAFSMIGIGVGLILAPVMIVGWLVSLMHHMFIFGVQWSQFAITLVSPVSLIVTGSVLIYRDRSKV